MIVVKLVPIKKIMYSKALYSLQDTAADFESARSKSKTVFLCKDKEELTTERHYNITVDSLAGGKISRF